MLGIVKNKRFLIGLVTGTVVGPIILGRVAPSLRAKLPS